MFIKKIGLTNFKSFEKCQFDFQTQVNLIYGLNGYGKTNVLDAIYMLALSKSNFSLNDKQLVKRGTDFYRIEGEFISSSETAYRIVCKYKLDGKKEIEINGRKSGTARDLIGRIPVVFIAPDDISIVRQASLDRRNFMDRILCQADSEYLDVLISYNRMLRKKDALLKADRSPDSLTLEAYNRKMAPLAMSIYQLRKRFIEQIKPLFQEHYRRISDAREVLSIEYLSQLEITDDVFREMQNLTRQEISAKRPLFGIQKDDLDFQMDGVSLKKFGSQGQVKSFIYSLRIAEYIYLKKILNANPILIMDDFFEKLDEKRLTELLRLIAEESVDQVFLSDTERERSERIFQSHGIKFDAFEIV